jgi:hypothetical protein
METMIAVGLLIIALLLMYSGTRIVAEKLDKLEPQPLTDSWRLVEAEVISVLHVGNRHFVMVSYRVGRELFRNDVMRPVIGTAPAVGDHVFVRYDPAAPARVLLEPGGRTRPRVSSR